MLDLLQPGGGDVTDPARLHAELWADSVLKVVSCWLPFLLSTIVVGRDLLGSSVQCFPLHMLHGTVQCVNGTFVSDGNSSNNTFSEISVYTRQMSEFVNVYCAGQESFCTNNKFSYQEFAMMLVIQAALMYAPLLVWNVTIGREIICDVRFIACDMVVLYDRFRKEKNPPQNVAWVPSKLSLGNAQFFRALRSKNPDGTQATQTGEGVGNWNGQVHAQADGQDEDIDGPGGSQQQGSPPEKQQKGQYEQEELVYAYKIWRKTRVVYIWYHVKQAVSCISVAAFIVIYCLHHPIAVESIREKFQCSVENKFLVTCTVPAAKVHQFVWWTNMVLLSVSVILTLTHIIMLHARAKDEPFAKIGIRNKEDQTTQVENQDQEERQDRSQGTGCNDDQPVAETGSNDDDDDASFVTVQSQVILDEQRRPGNTQNEANQVTERPRKWWSPLNDSQMMHSFFKANIESVEKYNYVKSILKVAPNKATG